MQRITKKLQFSSNKSGFTLIELLLVMIIIALISSASFAIIKRFTSTQSLGVYYEDMKNDLNLAKSSALSQIVKKCKSTVPDDPTTTADNYKLEGYRFTYTSTGYTIEEVCSRTITNPQIKSVTFPENVSIDVASPVSIVFYSRAGGTDISTPPSRRVITLESGDRARTITVYRSGIIEGGED